MSPAPVEATGHAPVNVLFVLRNFDGYFRFYESAIELLAERGHHVHLALEQKPGSGDSRLLNELERRYGSFRWSTTRHLRSDPWYQLASRIRRARDYVYYFRPQAGDAPGLMDRTERKAPAFMIRLMRLPLVRRPAAVALLDRALGALERAIPSSHPVESFVRKRRADVLLIAPRMMPGSIHSAYVRAARAVGVRSAVCVASWDNLSSKQLLRELPDVLMVWNETQRREAVELHGVPPDRIAITGAQCFDHWFDWTPRPRKEFCRLVGLDPERPYLLYVGGALFPARRSEREFVEEWLERVRASEDPELRDAGVLIRPHPKRRDEWRDADFGKHANVAVWPADWRMPIHRDARADYGDSIFHSAGVAGLNTSALIEAGILDRRVHTPLVPEFAASQEQTPHFRYLMEVGGGLLRTTRDLDEHLAQLAESIRAGGRDDRASRRFVEAFIRPHGIDRAATPIFAGEVERLARMGPPEPVAGRKAAYPVRVGMQAAARATNLGVAWGSRRRRRAAAAARGRVTAA